MFWIMSIIISSYPIVRNATKIQRAKLLVSHIPHARGRFRRHIFPLTVANLGPDAAPGAVVSDTFPAGGAVTYTVPVGPIPLGNWVNTAEVIAHSGISDPVPVDNRVSFSFMVKQIFLPTIVKP
jgi:hypothetical protein